MYNSHASVCVCLCVRLCLSVAACPHYCTDPDATWENGRGCPLAVQYSADLQSVHGFRCYDNIQVCRLIALYAANAYSAEREMSPSACTRTTAGLAYFRLSTGVIMEKKRKHLLHYKTHVVDVYSKILGLNNESQQVLSEYFEDHADVW